MLRAPAALLHRDSLQTNGQQLLHDESRVPHVANPGPAAEAKEEDKREETLKRRFAQTERRNYAADLKVYKDFFFSLYKQMHTHTN